MSMKFSFKTVKPTGPYRSFYSPQYLIKVNKKQVGIIGPDEFKARLMVYKKDINEDGNPNCKWKWIKLKHKSKTLEEAKIFIKEHAEEILNKNELKLHSLED